MDHPRGLYGANALLETWGIEPLRVEDFTPETASDSFNGTLYSQSGIHWLRPDSIEFWAKEDGLTVTSWRTGKPEPASLYDRSYLDVKDKYSAFLGGNQPLCVIKMRIFRRRERKCWSSGIPTRIP